MPTELSTHEMTELLIYAAGNPIASSSLHTLGDKGLLVFDASSTPFWKLSPQGKETVTQEYKRKQETKDAILQAILDKRANVVNDALRVLSTYGVKAGIASGKITVNRMSNNTLRLHFEGTISRRLQQRLNECRFQYSSSGYWWHDDDDLGKKFLSEHLGADEFVGDDSDDVCIVRDGTGTIHYKSLEAFIKVLEEWEATDRDVKKYVFDGDDELYAGEQHHRF